MIASVTTDLLVQHGGRLSVARSLYADAPQPWIDLSTGINPNPYPAPRASTLARARLPEPWELRALETAAACAFGVGDPARVAAASGSEPALRLLPQVLPSAVEATIVWPHNPDGTLTGRGRLLAAHDRIAALGGFLVVDEAFADVEGSCSVAAVAGSERYPRLVVLRSFGKFYGLAGIRLGFVIAAPQIVTRIRASFGDWPVSADAIAAGLAAYADTGWAENTRVRLRNAARKLDALLMRNDLSVVGGTSLFRLARSAIARARFEQLLRAGILVRPFGHDTTLLRFGLPHGAAAWRRLRDALKERL